MKLLDKLQAYFRSNSKVSLAVLFGSAAKNRSETANDIDLGIRLDTSANAAQMQKIEIELGRITGNAIDIIALDQAPALLRFEIARDGIVIVENKPYDWADFRARAMLDWWDWAPTAHRINETLITGLRGSTNHGSK